MKFLKEKECFFLTLLILAMGIYIFRDFLLWKRLYIFTDIGNDTLYQYWPNYVNFARALESGSFPFWLHNIGIGGSIFSAGLLLFEPFSLICSLVGKENIIFSLPYGALLKILLAGLFFYKYVLTLDISRYSALVFSFLYAFNGYIIVWGQHYHMATIIVFLPLLLLSFESWLQRSKGSPFSLSIALIALYSYYFLYMTSFFLLFYACSRYASTRGFRGKDAAVFFAKTLGFYLLGIGLSSILFFPSIFIVLSSPRVAGSALSWDFFRYPGVADYITLVLRFFSNDFLGTGNSFFGQFYGWRWSNYYEAPLFYSGLLVLLLIPLLFYSLDGKARLHFLFFLSICFFFILSPFFSILMAGFSDATFRWMFFIIITQLTLAAKSLDIIISQRFIRIKPLVGTLVFIMLIPAAAIFVGKFKIGWTELNFTWAMGELKAVIIFLSVYTFIIWLFNFHNLTSIAKGILLLTIFIEIACFSYPAVNNRDTLSMEYLNHKQGYFDYTNDAVDYIKTIDHDFFRIDKDYNSEFLADSLMQDYNGVKSYSPLNHPSYISFLKEMSVPFPINESYIEGFPSRLSLHALLGTRYLMRKNAPPYGFKYLKTLGDVHLYKNTNFLPIGFTYDKYMDCADFSSLTAYEKDEAILKAFAYCGDTMVPEGVKKFSVDTLKKVQAEKINMLNDNIMVKNSHILKNSFPLLLRVEAITKDPQLFIPLDSPGAIRKVFVQFEMESQEETHGQIFWSKGTHNFKEEESRVFKVYAGRKRYEVDLGFIDLDVLRIDVAKSEGFYSIENFTIFGGDISEFTKDIEKLNEETLIIKEFGNDFIKGEINLSAKKFLFFSIPYDKGWMIKVDGKRANVEKATLGFVGTFLDKGFHEIELLFVPPYLVVGCVSSLISLFILFLLMRCEKQASAFPAACRRG